MTKKAIDKFKRLPPVSGIVDLLKAEAGHEQVVSRGDGERVIIPIEKQSDQEIVDQLVRRAFRNDAWPIIESERGQRLAQQAARAFLREMNPKKDAHRMGFYMLRNRGLIPTTAKLDT